MDILLLIARFEFHLRINIHVPQGSVQHPVAVDLVIQPHLPGNAPRILQAEIAQARIPSGLVR